MTAKESSLEPSTTGQVANLGNAGFFHRWRVVLTCAFVFLSTCAVYWPLIHHEFINYDDQDYVVENLQVQRGLTWEGAKWAFQTDHAGNWHPLTWLSHMLDCEFFGMNAGGHHFTSMLLHAATSVLLFLLLRKTTTSFWRSAFVALVFALHPVHVESVAWASERKDVLSASFFMLTLLAYAHYAKTKQSKAANAVANQQPRASLKNSPFVYYLLSLFLFALGLMSKPMLVTLPFILLLLDYWPLARFGTGVTAGAANIRSRLWRLILEKIPFFALSAISSIVTFTVQHRTGTVARMDVLPVPSRLENVVVSYLLYLQKLFWPSKLVPFYPYEAELSFILVLVAFVLLVGLTIFAALNWKRFPYLIVGWLWYLGMLVPVIGLVQVGAQSMADRYSYLPSIGITLIVAWGLYSLAMNRPALRIPSCFLQAAALAACFGLTVVQVRYWLNSETLFRHTVSVSKNNYLAHHNLGTVLVEQGKLEEAAEQFSASVRAKPTYAQSQSDLGLTLVLLGRVDEAIEHYQAAISVAPRLDKPHFNLGRAYSAQGKKDEAISEYEAALKLNPAYLEARTALAATLVQEGRTDEAITQFNELLRYKPDDENTHFDLANLLRAQGKIDEAENHLREAVRVKPDDPDVLEGLGVLLAQKGGAAEASGYLAEAVRLRPNARVCYEFGLTLVIQGRRREAAEQYRRSLQFQSDWPAPMNDLAWILATDPDPTLRNGPQAVDLASKACELTQGKEPRFWGTLDAAYAECGKFEDAVRTATKTRDLALAAGQKEIAEAAEKRLALYQSRKPFQQ